MAKEGESPKIILYDSLKLLLPVHSTERTSENTVFQIVYDVSSMHDFQTTSYFTYWNTTDDIDTME